MTGVSVDGLESAFIANRETMIEGDIKTQIEEHLREHLNQPYFKEYVAQYEKAVDALNHQNKNRGDLVDFKKWPDDMFNSINKGSRGVPMKWNPTTDTVIPKLALKSVDSGPRHTALVPVHSISSGRAHPPFLHLHLCVFGPNQPLLHVRSGRIRPR